MESIDDWYYEESTSVERRSYYLENNSEEYVELPEDWSDQSEDPHEEDADSESQDTPDTGIIDLTTNHVQPTVAKQQCDMAAATSSNRNMLYPEDEGNKCPICLEDLLFTCSEIGTVSPCGHVFHKSCFDLYAKPKKKEKIECPTCKRKCNEFVRLYLTLLKPEEEEVVEDDESINNADDDETRKCGKDEVAKDHSQTRCKQNPRRLRQKIQQLQKDLSSLENVRDHNKELHGQCVVLKKDLSHAQDDARRYQERQIMYEREKVQKNLELIKKEREIQRMRKEMDALNRELTEVHMMCRQIKDNQNIAELKEIRKSNGQLKTQLESFMKSNKEKDEELSLLKKEVTYLKRYGNESESRNVNGVTLKKDQCKKVDGALLITRNVSKPSLLDSRKPFARIQLQDELEVQPPSILKQKIDSERMHSDTNYKSLNNNPPNSHGIGLNKHTAQRSLESADYLEEQRSLKRSRSLFQTHQKKGILDKFFSGD